MANRIKGITVEIGIDTFEGFGKFRDLDGDSLYSVSQAISPPRQDIKKAPAFLQVLKYSVFLQQSCHIQR